MNRYNRDLASIQQSNLYSSEAKRGTTTFHAYATLYARVRNKRYTLALRQVTNGETTSDVLSEFLTLLDGLDLGVKAVYLDGEFYNSDCIDLLSAHNYAYVMPIVKWGDEIKEELNSGWSRIIQHSIADSVTFPIFIDCVYQQGRYDEHGVARHGWRGIRAVTPMTRLSSHMNQSLPRTRWHGSDNGLLRLIS